MGPRRPLGGIRIFYSSSILWDSDLSLLFGLKNLLTPTLGSRNRFLPESPLIPEDGVSSSEDSEDTPRSFLRPFAYCFCSLLTPIIPVNICTSLPLYHPGQLFIYEIGRAHV